VKAQQRRPVLGLEAGKHGRPYRRQRARRTSNRPVENPMVQPKDCLLINIARKMTTEQSQGPEGNIGQTEVRSKTGLTRVSAFELARWPRQESKQPPSSRRRVTHPTQERSAPAIPINADDHRDRLPGHGCDGNVRSKMRLASRAQVSIRKHEPRRGAGGAFSISVRNHPRFAESERRKHKCEKRIRGRGKANTEAMYYCGTSGYCRRPLE